MKNGWNFYSPHLKNMEPIWKEVKKMLTLILSIVFWCNPRNKKLGIAAACFALGGFLITLVTAPMFAIIDLSILIANLIILGKIK